MFPTVLNTARVAVSLLAATSDLPTEFHEKLMEVTAVLSDGIFQEPDDTYLAVVDEIFNWDDERQDELKRALAITAGIQRDPIETSWQKYHAARQTMAQILIAGMDMYS